MNQLIVRAASAAAIVPNTGDTSNTVLWIGVLAGSAVALIVALLLLRKRR